MKLTLTRSEMLARWRLHRGYDIPHHDASVGRSDGIDLDSILEAEMDEWYRNLLLTAPLGLLAPVEKAGIIAVPGQGSVRMRLHLGETAVRIAAVRLSGWRCTATVVSDPLSPAAMRQLHPFTRASADAPVAVFDPLGHTLDLYPYHSGTDKLETLRVVERCADTYSFDSSALSLI